MCPAFPSTAERVPTPGVHAAFVGGLVLNVMPCVLPVVPLKIMGFYEVAQHSRAKSLAFGAVFSAGLVASFVWTFHDLGFSGSELRYAALAVTERAR